MGRGYIIADRQLSPKIPFHYYAIFVKFGICIKNSLLSRCKGIFKAFDNAHWENDITILVRFINTY